MKALFLFLSASAVLAHDTHVPAAKYVPTSVPYEIGSGEFRYRLVPNWAQKNRKKFPIGNGKAVVEDAKGNLYFLNGSKQNSVVVLKADGSVTKAFGGFAQSPHGINIVREGDQEFLFISDNGKNGKIFKTDLNGKVLMTVPCPVESGLYPDPAKFRPAEIIPISGGDFFVLDGYGSDYILRFNAQGKFISAFGGNIGKGEATLAHWGPHGGNIDNRDPNNPILILGLSDQQKIKRFKLDGTWIDTIPVPGGNPRDIIFHRGHIFVPHLGDDWPKQRNNPGYMSVMDYDFKVVANLGGNPPVYQQGKLQKMEHNVHAFYHPHALCVSRDGSLYVAQDGSNNTYPLKFKPIQ